MRNTALKARLADRSSGSGTDAAASTAKSANPLATDKEPIDWKKMAGQIAEMQSAEMQGDGSRAFLRLRMKILALSKDELVAALAEIAALDLPDDSKGRLQRLLLYRLCEKDSELALRHSLDQIDGEDGSMRVLLTRAMKSWAGKDPAAATAWFDQQIAAGKFDSKSLDGKNAARIEFEGSLIGALISTDIAAATARLKSLPEDQRGEALRKIRNFTTPEAQLAHANLVRTGLSQKAQTECFTQQASIMARKGYAEVTEYLDCIKATPAERAVCVEKAAGVRIQKLSQDKKVSREDIDTLREWVASQAPGTADKLTGKVIGESMRADQKLSFPEAAALATQYHATSGNDEVLIGFLTSCDLKQQPSEEVLTLIAKISDAKQREDFLSRLK